MLCLMAGCDPAAVPRDPNQISMQLTVGEHGDGSVRLGFGRQPGESQLVEIGQELTTSVFVGAPVTPTIDSNDGGYPFLVINSANIFEPGAHPQVLIDTTTLCRVLLAQGYTQISFSVQEPQTPHAWALTPSPPDAGSSIIDNCDSAPRGTLTMSPQPWRWWAVMALVVACLAAESRRTEVASLVSQPALRNCGLGPAGMRFVRRGDLHLTEWAGRQRDRSLAGLGRRVAGADCAAVVDRSPRSMGTRSSRKRTRKRRVTR